MKSLKGFAAVVSFAAFCSVVCPAEDILNNADEIAAVEEAENYAAAETSDEKEAVEESTELEVESLSAETETAFDAEAEEAALREAEFRVQEEMRIADSIRNTTREYSVNEVLFETVEIDGGYFMMGSADSLVENQMPVHEAHVSGFEMARTEVTQELYEAVIGRNASSLKYEGNPVENVSWYDAIVFCNRLSMALNLNPCYSVNNMTNPDYWKYTPQSGSQISGKITLNTDADGFRLPSEAEWEYAARGGSTGLRYDYIYSGSNNIEEVAVYKDNSTGPETPGQRYMNELGLQDLSGNVYEWCWDWMGFYSEGLKENYFGPESGTDRILRGGSWRTEGEQCRIYQRYSLRPGARYDDVGFRIVRHVLTDEERRAAARKAKADKAASAEAEVDAEYRKASSKRFAAGAAYSLSGDLSSAAGGITFGNMANLFFYYPFSSNCYWGLCGAYGAFNTGDAETEYNVDFTTRFGVNTPLLFDRMCRFSAFVQAGIINFKIGAGAGIDLEFMNMFTVRNFGIGLDATGTYNVAVDGTMGFAASLGLEVLIPNIPKQGL